MARRNNNAFEKRMREQAKRERQEAKKQRKAERAAAEEEGGEDVAPSEDPEVLMAQLAELHQRYENEEISLEELEEQRADLTERLTIQ